MKIFKHIGFVFFVLINLSPTFSYAGGDTPGCSDKRYVQYLLQKGVSKSSIVTPEVFDNKEKYWCWEKRYAYSNGFFTNGNGESDTKSGIIIDFSNWESVKEYYPKEYVRLLDNLSANARKDQFNKIRKWGITPDRAEILLPIPYIIRKYKNKPIDYIYKNHVDKARKGIKTGGLELNYYVVKKLGDFFIRNKRLSDKFWEHALWGASYSYCVKNWGGRIDPIRDPVKALPLFDKPIAVNWDGSVINLYGETVAVIAPDGGKYKYSYINEKGEEVDKDISWNDKTCPLSELKATYTKFNKCWMCYLLAKMYDAISITAFKFFEGSVDFALLILGLGVALWMAYRGLVVYAGLQMADDPKSFINEVFDKLKKAAIISAVLVSFRLAPNVLFKYTVDPILQFGMAFGTKFFDIVDVDIDESELITKQETEIINNNQKIANLNICDEAKLIHYRLGARDTTVEEETDTSEYLVEDDGEKLDDPLDRSWGFLSKEKASTIEKNIRNSKGRIMSVGLRDLMVCYVDRITKMTAKQLTVGSVLINRTFSDKDGNFVFFNLTYLIPGILIFIFFLWITFYFPLIFLKYIVYIGLTAVVLPMIIVGYAFNYTGSLLGNAVSRIAKYSVNIIFLSFSLSFALLLIYAVYEKNITGFNVVDKIQEAFDTWKVKPILEAFETGIENILLFIFAAGLGSMIMQNSTKLSGAFGFGDSSNKEFYDIAEKLFKGIKDKIFGTSRNIKNYVKSKASSKWNRWRTKRKLQKNKKKKQKKQKNNNSGP